ASRSLRIMSLVVHRLNQDLPAAVVPGEVVGERRLPQHLFARALVAPANGRERTVGAEWLDVHVQDVAVREASGPVARVDLGKKPFDIVARLVHANDAHPYRDA